MMEVEFTAIRQATGDTKIFELRAPGGGALPAAQAGAHIDLHLPGGLVRQYSLLNACENAPLFHYAIGVKLEEQGSGGSRYLHDVARVGERLSISAPRNNFRLVADESSSVLIAGGIGVTPLISMYEELRSQGRPVRLHYGCRSRANVLLPNAFMQGDANVNLHIDDESGARPLDLASVVQASPSGAHFYCCGPRPMLEAFSLATSHLPLTHVHVEYFSADVPASAQARSEFVVKLARSQRELRVTPGQTILNVLVQHGFDVPYSCEEGLCGVCVTGVLDGIPDHRDTVMTAAEQASNRKMMVCCSGSLSERLVLDL